MADSSTTAPETLTRQAVRGTSWSAFSSIARQLLALACSAILARLLGPEAYGLMGMVTLIAVFLYNFRDIGTTTVIIQRPSIDQRLLSTVFWVNCALGLALCSVVLCIALPAAHFFKEPRLTRILAVSSLTFVIASIGLVPNAVLTRNMQFGKLGIVDMCSSIGGYLVAIPCAIAGFGVWSLVFANLTNAIVTTSLNWRLSGWTPSAVFDMPQLRSVRSFSLNLSGFGLVNYFSRNADNLVVGKFLGESPLGFYQMAYNLMLYPILNISLLISQVLRPAFAKIQADDERFRQAYVKSCMLIGLFTFPIIAGMGILADPLVRALLGPKWIPAIILFQILAPVGFVQSIHTTVGQIYVSKGRTDVMFKAGIATAMVLVPSFLIGVRRGTVGVASAYAIACLVILLYPLFAVPFRLIGLSFSYFIGQLLPQLTITGVMMGACCCLLAGLELGHIFNVWIRIVSVIVLGSLTYMTLMIRIRPAVVVYFEETIRQSDFGTLIRALRWIGLFPDNSPDEA